MKITCQIDLKRIDLTVLKRSPKRTIKEERTTFLNIYNNNKRNQEKHIVSSSAASSDLSVINLDHYTSELLKTVEEYEKQKKVPRVEYEPSLDMFAQGTFHIECVESMACELLDLDQAQRRLLYWKKRSETESDIRKDLAMEKFKKLKRSFLHETRETGRQFIFSFEKMYSYYGTTNCLMVIFVEVVKSMIKKGKTERPSSKQIQNLRELICGMFSRNKFNKYDSFFKDYEEFEELFNRTYSLSYIRNYESPSHQSTSSSSCVSLR